jgi:hypothetical protein
MKSKFFNPATGLTILLLAGLFVACGGLAGPVSDKKRPLNSSNPSPTTASSYLPRVREMPGLQAEAEVSCVAI